MNTALWIVQIILSIKMISVFYTHGLRQSQSAMREAMQKLGRFSQPLHTIISACTVIASIGLILPGIWKLSVWITPAMSASVAVMLLASIFLHVQSRTKPQIFVSIILFAFAAFVAYGRWKLVPL
jgi:hypothetical protein